MHPGNRRTALLVLLGSILSAGLALPGCSDDRTKTGTSVEKSPEAQAGEKASMEGMRKAMEKAKGKAPSK
jgi:hypothetical protein